MAEESRRKKIEEAVHSEVEKVCTRLISVLSFVSHVALLYLLIYLLLHIVVFILSLHMKDQNVKA